MSRQLNVPPRAWSYVLAEVENFRRVHSDIDVLVHPSINHIAQLSLSSNLHCNLNASPPLCSSLLLHLSQTLLAQSVTSDVAHQGKCSSEFSQSQSDEPPLQKKHKTENTSRQRVFPALLVWLRADSTSDQLCLHDTASSLPCTLIGSASVSLLDSLLLISTYSTISVPTGPNSVKTIIEISTYRVILPGHVLRLAVHHPSIAGWPNELGTVPFVMNHTIPFVQPMEDGMMRRVRSALNSSRNVDSFKQTHSSLEVQSTDQALQWHHAAAGRSPLLHVAATVTAVSSLLVTAKPASRSSSTSGISDQTHNVCFFVRLDHHSQDVFLMLSGCHISEFRRLLVVGKTYLFTGLTWKTVLPYNYSVLSNSSSIPCLLPSISTLRLPISTEKKPRVGVSILCTANFTWVLKQSVVGSPPSTASSNLVSYQGTVTNWICDGIFELDNSLLVLCHFKETELQSRNSQIGLRVGSSILIQNALPIQPTSSGIAGLVLCSRSSLVICSTRQEELQTVCRSVFPELGMYLRVLRRLSVRDAFALVSTCFELRSKFPMIPPSEIICECAGEYAGVGIVLSGVCLDSVNLKSKREEINEILEHDQQCPCCTNSGSSHLSHHKLLPISEWCNSLKFQSRTIWTHEKHASVWQSSLTNSLEVSNLKTRPLVGMLIPSMNGSLWLADQSGSVLCEYTDTCPSMIGRVIQINHCSAVTYPNSALRKFMLCFRSVDIEVLSQSLLTPPPIEWDESTCLKESSMNLTFDSNPSSSSFTLPFELSFIVVNKSPVLKSHFRMLILCFADSQPDHCKWAHLDVSSSACVYYSVLHSWHGRPDHVYRLAAGTVVSNATNRDFLDSHESSRLSVFTVSRINPSQLTCSCADFSAADQQLWSHFAESEYALRPVPLSTLLVMNSQALPAARSCANICPASCVCRNSLSWVESSESVDVLATVKSVTLRCNDKHQSRVDSALFGSDVSESQLSCVIVELQHQHNIVPLYINISDPSTLPFVRSLFENGSLRPGNTIHLFSVQRHLSNALRLSLVSTIDTRIESCTDVLPPAGHLSRSLADISNSQPLTVDLRSIRVCGVRVRRLESARFSLKCHQCSNFVSALFVDNQTMLQCRHCPAAPVPMSTFVATLHSMIIRSNSNAVQHVHFDVPSIEPSSNDTITAAGIDMSCYVHVKADDGSAVAMMELRGMSALQLLHPTASQIQSVCGFLVRQRAEFAYDGKHNNFSSCDCLDLVQLLSDVQTDTVRFAVAGHINYYKNIFARSALPRLFETSAVSTGAESVISHALTAQTNELSRSTTLQVGVGGVQSATRAIITLNVAAVSSNSSARMDALRLLEQLRLSSNVNP